MCMMKMMIGLGELQNPGFRSGMFPQSGIMGVPYTWGTGFPIANTPTKNLANNAIGNKERERRKTASKDSYGRAVWNKKTTPQTKASIGVSKKAPSSMPGKSPPSSMQGKSPDRRGTLLAGGPNEGNLGRKTLLG